GGAFEQDPPAHRDRRLTRGAGEQPAEVVRRTEGLLGHVLEPTGAPFGGAVGALKHGVEQFTQAIASSFWHGSSVIEQRAGVPDRSCYLARRSAPGRVGGGLGRSRRKMFVVQDLRRRKRASSRIY